MESQANTFQAFRSLGLRECIWREWGVLYHVEFIDLNKPKVVWVVLIEILQLTNFYIRYLLSFLDSILYPLISPNL